ncbi:uncharacterized protein OCT59_006253 [Rhizophagus irregularis]|uniref:uncharacterized protein n=1 Tax=Rhizophagus irregularis TaxID=588596 RepID=UPI003322108C|nr:hypothetical protein OCT59_028449 [Rhizophagus irregularis]UZO14809.1 hypothetical protein OCT59_006253 [Rhizophagus irregularis]
MSVTIVMMMMMMVAVVEMTETMMIVLNNSLIQAYISLLPDLRFDLKKYRSTSIDLRFHAQFCLAWKSLVHRLSQQLFGNPGAVSGDQIFQFLFV